MIKETNEKTELLSLAPSIASKLELKDFTVSKFCCYLCYVFFESFAETVNESSTFGLKISFDLLGNSCAVFPRYKI